MRKVKKRALTIIVLFVLAELWFFFPIGKPEGASLLFAMRLALPAAVLAAGGVGLIPRLMTAGFCLCTLGDAMGVAGSFEGQMAGFAAAHVCFIRQFAGCIRRAPRANHKAAVVVSLLCLVPLVIAAQKILPTVQELHLRIGCAVYALLLAGTAWTATLHACIAGPGGSALPRLAAGGAWLFLASDFILAWNRFTAHIPRASLLIMTTYYAALLLLFVGTLCTTGQSSATANRTKEEI